MTKKYIITDPCYVLPDNIWEELCFKVYNPQRTGDLSQRQEDFNKLCTQYLQEFSGDYKAIACNTGYGDWSNTISGEDVTKADFCADSGMVCAVELTDTINDVILKSKESSPVDLFSLMAIIETDKDVSFQMDTSNREWTVVKVIDRSTGYTIASSSRPDDNEEQY